MSSNVRGKPPYTPPSYHQHPDGAAFAEQQRALRIAQQVLEEHQRAKATTQSGEADQAPQAHQQAAGGAAPALSRSEAVRRVSHPSTRKLPDHFTSVAQVKEHWKGLDRAGRIAFAELWRFDLSRDGAKVPEDLSDPEGASILGAVRRDLGIPDSFLGRVADAFRNLF